MNDEAEGKITIEPSHEPNGVGNGWVDCDDAVATHWFVYQADELIDGFDSRAEAEVHAQLLATKKPPD